MVFSTSEISFSTLHATGSFFGFKTPLKEKKIPASMITNPKSYQIIRFQRQTLTLQNVQCKVELPLDVQLLLFDFLLSNIMIGSCYIQNEKKIIYP